MERYYEYTAKVEELGLGKAIEEKPRIDVSLYPMSNCCDLQS
jgi:hypothetical protein